MFSFALSSKSPTQAARGSFVHLERPAAIPLKIGWGCLPSRSPPRGGKSHLGFRTGFLLWHSQPHDFVTLTVIPASTCDASLCLHALAYLLNSCVCPIRMVWKVLGGDVPWGMDIHCGQVHPPRCAPGFTPTQWGCYCVLPSIHELCLF